MTGSLNYFSCDYAFPATEPPSWAPAVERWYQLDAAAFGLPYAYEFWRQKYDLQKPSVLVLASPDGSNQTDYDFALSLKATGVASPSKFVHTLPNSRSSALLQVMGHGAPMICLQNDPATFVAGLDFGLAQIQELRSCVWVLGVSSLESGRHRSHLFQLTSKESVVAKAKNDAFSWRQRQFDDNGKSPSVTDSQLFNWLAEASSTSLPLAKRWELSRQA